MEQVTDQILGIALSLKKKRAVHASLPALKQLEQEGGLAHAGLPNQGDKSTVCFDSVKQGGHRLAMRGAEKKVARVRRYPERLFLQLIEFEKHSSQEEG